MLKCGLSKKDIQSSSRTYLNAIYQQYPNRACENLGISPNTEDDDSLTEDDYPSEFRTLSKEEREEFEKNDTRTDEEFLSQFPHF